jgi:hypothetical protein
MFNVYTQIMESYNKKSLTTATSSKDGLLCTNLQNHSWKIRTWTWTFNTAKCSESSRKHATVTARNSTAWTDDNGFIVGYAETAAMSIPADAQNECFTQNKALSTQWTSWAIQLLLPNWAILVIALHYFY